MVSPAGGPDMMSIEAFAVMVLAPLGTLAVRVRVPVVAGAVIVAV
ncbi:MAG: hypothetical protein M0007_09995 [Actinomycetota bacterium]|nr:hypothetical protein [Actinomycetota bacterium]